MPQQSYTENDVIEAILDVTDNHLSQHQAAQKHGMPQTTLSDRLRGLPSKSENFRSSGLLMSLTRSPTGIISRPTTAGQTTILRSSGSKRFICPKPSQQMSLMQGSSY
ncbi:Uncharacterized protein HZ326_25879 [Fusarium oxysporum f. sp. albedinis]|nr:Uncharacterized protein HZ326_25879 [Fusarium oxysporum f. sp. albedinis]